MTTTIKLKNSVTTTNAPVSLQQGEVAINIADKKVWVGNAATTPVQLLGDGSGANFTNITYTGTLTGGVANFTNLAYTGTLTGGTGVVNIGSGQFYKDASGNIGLGTATPAFKLDIQTAAATTIRLKGGSTTNHGSAYFITAAGSTTTLAAFGDAATILGGTPDQAVGVYAGLSTPLIFYTADTERMRITNGGNVGINTIPSVRFDVKESGSTVPSPSAGTVARFYSTGAAGFETFLGIVSGNTGVSGIDFGDTDAAAAGRISYNHTGNSMAFFTNGLTERMRIDSAGNLGLGTLSPTAIGNFTSLSVNGVTGTLWDAYVGGTLVNRLDCRSGQSSLNSYGVLSFGTGSGGSTTERMRITTGGDVSIGNTLTGSRLIIRGATANGYNNTFSQTNSTVQIISDEMAVDQWYPTFNITMVRQSLSTGSGAFGGIGFSTIDDSNNNGMYDAGRIAIVNNDGGTVESGTSMAFYTQVGSGTNTNPATERMRSTSAGLLQFNSGYGSVATAFGCRAWVNFNGTGTVAIRSSGNVSSITDNGTGDYTVNFTTAMPDANYSAVGSSGEYMFGMWSQAAGSCTVRVTYTTNLGGAYAFVDNPTMNVSVFR
jgi:hypothetical protein